MRVDEAICTLTDQANHAVESVRTRVTDADAQLSKLNTWISQALDDEAAELDPQGLQATRKFQQGIHEIRQHVDQVSVALEKTLAIVEILRSMGLEMDGHRISHTLERTEEIDVRLAKLSENIAEISARFRPDGTLRETVVNTAKERTLVTLEKVLLPTGLLIEECNQVADSTIDLLVQLRSRLRWTIFLVTCIVVVLTAWMALGQLALLRNGLRRAADRSE